VFLNPKAKIPRIREILTPKLVFLYFQASFEDFFRFGPTDGDMDSDFFVAADAKGADCVAGFGGDRGLAGELFEDFGGAGETIA
jgi:hypothetical protein